VGSCSVLTDTKKRNGSTYDLAPRSRDYIHGLKATYLTGSRGEKKNQRAPKRQRHSFKSPKIQTNTKGKMNRKQGGGSSRVGNLRRKKKKEKKSRLAKRLRKANSGPEANRRWEKHPSNQGTANTPQKTKRKPERPEGRRSWGGTHKIPGGSPRKRALFGWVDEGGGRQKVVHDATVHPTHNSAKQNQIFI